MSKNSNKQTGLDAFEMGSNSRKKKKVDQYGFTMHAKEESEENLNKKDSNNGEDDSGLGNHRDEIVEGEHGEHDGGILQTTSVTVAYDQVSESGGETTAATSWAAV